MFAFSYMSRVWFAASCSRKCHIFMTAANGFNCRRRILLGKSLQGWVSAQPVPCWQGGSQYGKLRSKHQQVPVVRNISSFRHSVHFFFFPSIISFPSACWFKQIGGINCNQNRMFYWAIENNSMCDACVERFSLLMVLISCAVLNLYCTCGADLVFNEVFFLLASSRSGRAPTWTGSTQSLEGKPFFLSLSSVLFCLQIGAELQ